MFSTAILSSPSCMFASTSRMEVTLLYLVLKLLKFHISDGKICQLQLGGLKNLFILQTQMSSHFCPLSCAPGERMACLFHGSKPAQRADRPPATTMTSFITTCASDPFARTLFYSEMAKYFTRNASSNKFQCRKRGKPIDGYANVY